MDGYSRPPLQEYENGNYADESFDLFSNVPNNDISWGLSINNESLAPPSHLNWQQSSATTPNLDSYGRPFSKSPSVTQATPSYGYTDPRQFVQSAYDPSLVPPSSIVDPAAAFVGHSQYLQQPLQQQHGTIAPQALQHGQSTFPRPIGALDSQGFFRSSNAVNNSDLVRQSSSAAAADQNALFSAIPQGNSAGIFSLIDYERLTSATNTRKINSFVNVGQQEYEYPINKAIIPAPARRKSRNELRDLAKHDPKLLAKLGKKHSKKTSSAIGTLSKPLAPTKQWQPTQGIKYEGDSSSDYTSSDDSEYESEDELAEPSPLPAKRPDEPVEAVKYDSIKATWRSKRFEVDSSEIRTGLNDFWDIVKTIRDRWKTDNQAVTEAETKKKLGELPLLRSRVKDQRNMLQAALEGTLQHGHKSILELFGENPALLYLLYQFLIDRHREEDFDSPLTRAILEILANCTTLTEDTLKKTHLAKVYPRFAKKGSTETQELVKRIDANVAEYKKKKTESPAQTPSATESGRTDGKPKSPPLSRPTPEPIAGVKRSAPSSTASGQPPKRVAPGPTGPASTTLAVNVKPAALVKRPATGVVNGKSATTTQPNGSKVKSALSKPAGSITGPTTVVRKPVAAKPAAKPAAPSLVANAIKSIEKKATGPGAAAPPKPAFSFAETMANLTKPKEKEPTPKAEEKRPPETAEQKAKRIRKEQRRKLRVTFKPDNQLVEVRLFHHDAEEELGHDESMIRDVADVGGEGRMFKQHKDMMDVDDEEEAGQEDLGPYNEPTMTDFTAVDAEERKRNYIPYGGGELEPETPERAARDSYEANTLMAYDSPPCPREPTDPYNGESIVTKDFGAPDSQSIAATRAVRFSTTPTPPQQQAVPSSTPDISAILALITPQQQQQQQLSPGPAPPMSVQQPSDQMTDIQRILANLPQASSQHQPIPQQQQQAPPQQPTSAVMPDIASILANLQPQGVQAATVPPVQQQLQTHQMLGMIPDPSNLAAILGQLNPGQSNGGAPALGSFPQFGFPSANFDMQSFTQGQSQNQTYENEERKRWREGGDEGSGAPGRKWLKKGKSGKGGDNLYTLPCKYWKSGKCQKGSACTYLHES